MEEQLQQSVMQSERDAELAETGIEGDIIMADGSAGGSQSQIDVCSIANEHFEDAEMDEDAEGEDDEDDANGEPNDDQSDSSSNSGSGDDDEDAFDEDAEGEEDEQIVSRSRHASRRRTSSGNTRRDDDEDEEEEEEEEDEGVGAVKIRPGETDNESDSDDSASSASISDNESDGVEDWEGGDNDDNDEGSENAEGHCIFCKQDEEHDPAEEFEVYLACTKCGDNGQSIFWGYVDALRRLTRYHSASTMCTRQPSTGQPNKSREMEVPEMRRRFRLGGRSRGRRDGRYNRCPR